jgi:hypothetical protein
MQKQNFSTRMKRIFLNETGQMTVFVALIFQVLFVFFAMVINIGLLVHDKINLQNAVDLGAYYGAQRQAEILNEIAHINYQIHQDNKLLAWRYWVLGTLGRDGGGSRPKPAVSGPSVSFGPTDVDPTGELPSVCVANLYWQEATAESTEEENYCFAPFGAGGEIKKIPPLIIIAPFVPGVINAALAISDLRNQQNLKFMQSGPLNWTLAAQMMEGYKMALTSRKAVIQRLRSNLVSKNFVDQTAIPVTEGVLNTIKKNLTASNSGSFQDDGFVFTNGLANPSCAGSNNDGSLTISEIRTDPTLLYTYPMSESGGYQIGQAPETLPSKAGNDFEFDPGGFLHYFAVGEPSDSIGNDQVAGLNGSSLGFEKNPWCMAYVGVHAKTAPRKPFAPFGESVSLEARSFAQPFGGRIGPWFRSQWPQASAVSTGARTDPLSTPRLLNGANEGGEDGTAQIPNYSRYPGDNLGMRSLAAQAAARRLLIGYRTKGSQLSYTFYLDFSNIPVTGDPLAWDTLSADTKKPSPRVTNVRQAELLAVAPDLYDVTYYSIDPNYASNYKVLNSTGARFSDLGSMFGNQISVPPDLGGRNKSDLDAFGVGNQIQDANSASGNGLDPILRSSGALNYFIFNVAHVLTGWAPKGATNFGFPDDRFAKCAHQARAESMIPGGCTNGGRSGYSVRILSRDHLLSGKWTIGGEGQAGPIKNPPPLDF